MPHRCQNCTEVIEDESDAVLDGCPDCGNQSWEYIASESTNTDQAQTTQENQSQKAARTEFVDQESLPSKTAADSLQSPQTGISKVDDAEEVRKQLNDQFDGIRVVKQGRYKINLTQLYQDSGVIVTVDESGRYTVERPTHE